MDTFIGLDFGGTKLLIGEVDTQGNVLAQKRFDTGLRDQEKAVGRIRECLAEYVQEVGFRGNPRAAGIGIVGVVDEEHGIWRSMDHRETNPLPLAELISAQLGIPVFIDNDVKSALAAEQRFGQGRNSRDYIYINVGTGLAAGFVVNGKVLRGANNNAGEVGHMVQDMGSGVMCICGRMGCAEGRASGSGLHTEAVRLLGTCDTKLHIPEDGSRVPAGEIFALADKGDCLCLAVAGRMVDELSTLIMNLVRVTDPDTVVLGGGVVSSGWLLPKIDAKLNGAAMRGVTRGVVLSSFDAGLVGLIGAAAHAMIRYETICGSAGAPGGEL